MPETTQQRKRRQPFVTLCGRIFRDTDPQYYPRAEYHGRTILFCTDSCLGAFLADPDLFYKVHRNSEKTSNDDLSRKASVDDHTSKSSSL